MMGKVNRASRYRRKVSKDVLDVATRAEMKVYGQYSSIRSNVYKLWVCSFQVLKWSRSPDATGLHGERGSFGVHTPLAKMGFKY